jgi:hypothetical protein
MLLADHAGPIFASPAKTRKSGDCSPVLSNGVMVALALTECVVFVP